MMFPLVRDLAGDGVPVTVTCRVLGFSTQAFYKWKKSPVTQRVWENAHLINAAYDIHADDPAFGYRFIADELPGRHHRRRESRSPVVFAGTSLVGVLEEEGTEQEVGPARPRRPRLPQIHRAGTEPVVAHGHYRTLDRHRKAVLVRDQGRAVSRSQRNTFIRRLS
jgi:hypothetical protein